MPLAVTADVPTGLVVVHDKVTLQVLAPEAIVQVGDAGVRVPDINPNDAVTVQAEVITSVV
jgi:hypothetical protein